jgi:hypothetical protein
MPCINVHLGFSGTAHAGRHGPILKLHLCICAISECRSFNSRSEWAAVEWNIKKGRGSKPKASLFFFNLRGAIQSLGDAEHYMCREWLDATWARNILCRSPVYHQSGVQADDQALKYVRHIKYHFMLCDFWGRGICTLTLVHLQGSEIMQGDPEVCTTYHMAWWKWTLLGQAEWFLPCTEYSVPMLYYSNLIPDIVWLAFNTE